MKNKIDPSSELLIKPINGGFKLIRPKEKNPRTPDLFSVNEVLNFPINVFFLDCCHNINNMNEETVITCGYQSVKKTIGKNINHIIHNKEIANLIINDNLKTIKSNQMVVSEENFIRFDETSFSAVTFKFPLYDNFNQITGIFGYSFAIGKNNISFADSLSLVLKSGLLPTPQKDIFAGNELDGVYFSNQELKCLKLLMCGMTTKMIGKYTKLSPRTVEHYIDNIKLKLNVRSKKDLIHKVFKLTH